MLTTSTILKINATPPVKRIVTQAEKEFVCLLANLIITKTIKDAKALRTIS